MAYLSSSVQVSAWVAVNGDSEIIYRVYPAQGIAEFTLGGSDGLELQTSEAGLRHCVGVFTAALDAFGTATASPPDIATADLVEPVIPPIDHAR
ncbi:MAG: hypothetical protein ACRDRO_19155 [Pseudonocardiaceae bacterium]